MKFPLSVRSGGASLVVAVSLLLSPIVSAQRPAKPPVTPPPRTPNATADANEKAPAATFDTLLSADAYGVYAEVRMIGREASSQEIARLIAPLTLGGGAPQELMNLYEFIKAHSEPLTTARLMVAAMPVRAGLPEALVAVEMPSVEEARKFLPELKEFIAVNVSPNTQVSDEGALVKVGDIPAQAAAATPNRRGRRRARGRATTPNARGEASRQPAALPFQVKRSGSIIAMSSEAFTFKNLRGTDEALLVNEPGFQAARTRFSTDTLFVYFNTVRMFSSTKMKSEAMAKEYRRQEELAQKEAAKQGITENSTVADIAGPGGPGDGGNTNASVNVNSNVAIAPRVNRNNANVAVSPEDEILPPPPVEVLAEPTPSPRSEKELEEERQ
ncbi:MAG TPA: hypothetical protein VF634_01700, partial [Pyrinomonadaceae bacterium]